MEKEVESIVVRLDATAQQLDELLGRIEARQSALSGEVERITATVEQGRREVELEARLQAAEQELATLKAGAASIPLRRTVPSATSELLAKRGVATDGGPIDVRALDEALAGLSLEQRIAVKTQLQRAGGIA